MEIILIFAGGLGPWFFGLVSWFFTGFDDLMIFSDLYHQAKTTRQRIEAISGLIVAVFVMIFLVTTIGYWFGLLKEYAWIGGFLPFSIAVRTWMGWGDTKEPRKGTFFIRTFTGFGFNWTDDIIYNTGVIAGKAIEYQVWYLGGILTGAVIMVALAHHLFRGMKDMPKLRASVMFLVSGYILYPGIEMIMRMIK